MDQRREAGWASEEASWRSSLYRLYGSCPERRPRPLPRCSLAQLAEAAFFPGAGACRVSGQRRRGRESERERAKGGGYTGYVSAAAEEGRTNAWTDGRRGGRRPAGAVAPPYRFPRRRRRRRRTPLRETHTETELRERREGRGRATDADDGRGRRRDT